MDVGRVPTRREALRRGYGRGRRGDAALRCVMQTGPVVGRVGALLWAARVCAGTAKGGASAEQRDRLAGRAGMRGMLCALRLVSPPRAWSPCALPHAVCGRDKISGPIADRGACSGRCRGGRGRDVAAGRYARRAGGVAMCATRRLGTSAWRRAKGDAMRSDSLSRDGTCIRRQAAREEGGARQDLRACPRTPGESAVVKRARRENVVNSLDGADVEKGRRSMPSALGMARGRRMYTRVIRG
jgi:hypothetical protein